MSAMGAVVALVVSFGSAHAADPNCAPLIKATVPDPNFPYRVTSTMMIGGEPSVSESVVIGGNMYLLPAKATEWTKVKMPDTKVLAEQAQQSLISCTAGGAELVGTTPTRVWTTQTTNPVTNKPMANKVWIGVADGRVYRQKGDVVEQVISYTNISVPSPVKPDRKR